jgi:hypothetical protein
MPFTAGRLPLRLALVTEGPLMTPYSEFLGALALAGHEPAAVIRDIVERAAARSGVTFEL